MSKKIDNIIKNYLSNNERFSDIVNYYLFDGKDIVKASDLKELDTTEVNTSGEIFEKTRDLYKEINIKEDDKNTYILVGIENQTKMDYEMVARVMLYDSLSLRKEFKKRINNDKIKPVITIVIYYGNKKCNYPKCIHDYYKDIDDKILKFIPNHHINLIEPYQMNDNDIEKFKSDFKIVCDFMRNSFTLEGIEKIRKKNYRDINKETIGLINYITESRLVYLEEEDKIDMCKGLDEFAEKYKNEGKTEGALENEQKNIKTMHKNGFEPEMIAKALSLDINYVKEVLAK